MIDAAPARGMDSMSETDAVMNDETRRALGRRGRQVGMVVVGGIVAIVLFGVVGLAAILSVPWQLHLVVTIAVALALPVAVPYAMLRVYGLATRDVVFVAKRAYREIAAEIIALSGTSTVSGAFDESGTDEAPGVASHSPVEDGSDDANPGFESGESTDESSTETDPTDLQQQTDPQPQS